MKMIMKVHKCKRRRKKQKHAQLRKNHQMRSHKKVIKWLHRLKSWQGRRKIWMRINRGLQQNFKEKKLFSNKKLRRNHLWSCLFVTWNRNLCLVARPSKTRRSSKLRHFENTRPKSKQRGKSRNSF